ncbi:MAG: S41 family peptidase [Bacteroidetes Order II. Incertae sedis bacterium]|nr:S41 family peptidase [Bacteroidetes Order II. bacterium]
MKYLRVWLVLIPICALLFVGFRNDDLFFQLKKNFTIFGKIYEELATGYVDPVDPEKLLRKGVNEMMRSLDPYTVFFDEADNEDAEMQMRGGLGTVGAAIGMREGKVTVVELLEGYSAAEQGIRVGDAIIQINGKPTTGQTIREIASLLNGEPGSALTLKIERQGETELLNFSLLRKKLELKNVTHAGFVADDTTRGIGYIKLAQFGRDCAREVKEAVLSLKNTHKLKGLVLDLRGNPGGLLDQAIMITSLFVPEGSAIVSTKGRLATSEQLVKSAVQPVLPDTPLTILLDRASASASEVVSGAIQDLDRGVIIGETSFGKGLVQAVKPLVYNTSMKFTTAKYYTPSGRCIQALNYSDVDEDGAPVAVPDSLRKSFKTKAGRTVKDGKGIDPDLAVKMGTTTELEQALQRRSAFLFFANQFAANRPTIATNFDVTDGLLNEFRQWLNSQNFSYKTKSEKSLEKLQAELTKAGYTRSNAQAQSLLNQINREKNDDFSRNAPRLKLLLRSAILARYYGPVAQIKAQMINDPFLSEAEKVIRDNKRYMQILGQKS